MDKNYKNIQDRIDKFKKKKIVTQVYNSSMAFNIAIELTAGVLVGVIVGIIFDNLFDSKPLFLIICLLLSIIASFKLIWNKYIKKNVS